jgi:hypothetical protein
MVGFLLICLATPRDAHAYLDPMTGSVILQAVVAGVLGTLFAVKVYWRKIKAFFTGRAPETGASQPSQSSESTGPISSDEQR